MAKKYKVGYGNPPKKTQFKKGVSGNTKGRPKDSPNLKTALIQEMGRIIEIREGDRVRKVSKCEALPIRLFERALSGDMRAVVPLINLILRILPPEEAEKVVTELLNEDLQIIQEFLRSNRKRDHLDVQPLEQEPK